MATLLHSAAPCHVSNSTCDSIQGFKDALSTWAYEASNWLGDSSGNLCQLSEKCYNIYQPLPIFKSSARTSIRDTEIAAAVSICQNNVVNMADRDIVSKLSKLSETCLEQGALVNAGPGQYSLSKYTDVGCCQSWVFSNLFPGRPLPNGYAPLSICPISQFMEPVCPQPSNNVVPVKGLLNVCDT